MSTLKLLYASTAHDEVNESRHHSSIPNRWKQRIIHSMFQSHGSDQRDAVQVNPSRPIAGHICFPFPLGGGAAKGGRNEFRAKGGPQKCDRQSSIIHGILLLNPIHQAAWVASASNGSPHILHCQALKQQVVL
jgi:hypothetical protein